MDHLSADDSTLQTEDVDTSKVTGEDCKELSLHTSDSSNKMSLASIKTEVEPDSHIKTEVPEASPDIPGTDTGVEDHRPRGILFTLGEEAEEEDDQAR